MKLSDYNAHVSDHVLVMEPVNGSPRVEWRALHGQPVPYTATIQRNGDTVSMRELGQQIMLDGPVAYWLRYYTAVDVAAVLREDPNEPAYAPELEYADQQARQTSLLPIDLGFDPRRHDMPIALIPGTNQVTYEEQHTGKIRIAVGGPGEIEAELSRAGYSIRWQ
jgi:hypothetical protein